MSLNDVDLKTLSQEEKLDLIVKLLIGNPLDKDDDGLIGDVRATKSRLYKLEVWKTKVVSWAIGVSFGGGALFTFLVSQLLKK